MSEVQAAPEAAPVTAPIAAPSSLLGGIKKEAAPAAPAASGVDNSWAWGEGIAGNGDRPEYLSEKYKTVADQAKAYKELEKRLIAGEGKVPDNYDFGNYQEILDTSNQHIQEFVNTAKEARLPQETFNKVLNSLVEYERSQLPNTDAEIAKLGDGAHEKIETVKRWAANNLSQEACDTLGAIGNRADVIKFVDELRQISLHNTSMPGSSDPGSNFVRLTKEDIDKELDVPSNAKRYLEDSNYRREIQNKLKIIYGED